MPDAKVSTLFEIVDRSSTTLGKIGKHTEGLSHLMDRAKDKARELSHSLLGVAAGVGIGAGIYETGKRIYEMGEFAETSEYKLSALAQTFGMVKPGDISGGLKIAADMMKELQSASENAGVSFTQFLPTFTSLAMQGRESGVSLNQTLSVLKSMAPAAQLLGTNISELGQQIQMGIAGRIPRSLILLLQQEGMTAQQYEQLKILQRIGSTGQPIAKHFMSILESVTKTKSALSLQQAYLLTTPAIVNRIKDTFDKVYMSVGHIVLAKLDVYFEHVAEWMTQNQDKITIIAEKVGTDIVKGLQLMVRLLEFASKHWKAILATTMAYKALTGLGGLATASGVIGGAVGEAGAVGGIGTMIGKMISSTGVGSGFAVLIQVLSKASMGLSSLAGAMDAVALGPIVAFGAAIAALIAAFGILGYAIYSYKKISAIYAANKQQEITSDLKYISDMNTVLGRGGKLNEMQIQLYNQATKYLHQAGVAVPTAPATTKISAAIPKMSLLDIATKGFHEGKEEAKKTPIETSKKADTIQNFYGDLTFHQDFKDVTPDKVMMHIVDQFERIAERSRQSGFTPAFGAT